MEEKDSIIYKQAILKTKLNLVYGTVVSYVAVITGICEPEFSEEKPPAKVNRHRKRSDYSNILYLNEKKERER